MEDLSEQKLKAVCPHCDPNSFAMQHKLGETKNFWIICDAHPFCEGHVLIIPKAHLSCIGVYPEEPLSEFIDIYEKVSEFIKNTYRSIGSFEHGIIGQTVFHSHVQMFPFSGKPEDVVPEGIENLTRIDGIGDLPNTFQKEGKYLFFSIGSDNWTVNSLLGAPRFFRDRFAKALGCPERGNWKEMRNNPALMSDAQKEIENLKLKWKQSFPDNS